MSPEIAGVRRWLQKADNDRRTAEAAMAQEPPITDSAAFHAQQAIKKLLTAYLVFCEHEFEKIRDLECARPTVCVVRFGF